VHPIAFQLGSLTIHWYGVMVALGFLAGLWTASRRGMLVGFAPDKTLDVGPWIIVGAIVGARVLYVISYWDEQFAGRPLAEVFMVWHGGLVYYGGLIGSCLAVIIYSRVQHMPLWKMADVLTPSVALGYACGRIGCLMNGCCYGRECHLPWAIRYPRPHETHPPDGPAIPVHPTQIYDSLLSLALYAALAWLFRHKKYDGQVFVTYLLSYAALRSLVEFFRGDYPQHYLGGWATPAHLVSMVTAAIGLILLFALKKAGTARRS